MILKEYGHFNDSENNYPEYPTVVSDYSWKGDKRGFFIQNLAKLQSEFLLGNIGKVLSYKGTSRCRICGELNGSSEFIFIDSKTKTKHVWPGGYLHYIRKHRVKPEDDFIKLIEKLSLLIN